MSMPERSPEDLATTLTREDLLSLGAEALAALLLDMTQAEPAVLDRLRQAVIAHRESDPDGADQKGPYLVGNSPVMRTAFEAIRRFAPTDTPVLITGESGTGKELAALALHERSNCAAGPFVPINCAGLPPTLIGSELFGHEKGAFTGAYQRKIGRIEAAQGGTVFLDEIGDLPLELQPHLLRFLQEKTIDRVGGNRPITADVRVVAATNMDLTKAIQEGRFREDLFYRLNVLTLRMPPLRERGDDVDLLSTFFLQKFADEMKRPVQGFEPQALRQLRLYGWPGNVRELVSCIRRAVVMSDGPKITARDLGFPLGMQSGNGVSTAARRDTVNGYDPASRSAKRVTTLKQAKREAEVNLLLGTLEQNGQNIKQTAEVLGVSRVTLYRLLKEHGISTGN
ncbi:MAG TPA: sigma-54 dependent transcriptional regulator [Kiloniellales bacterium]|jgi:DNA-binding NtrC family response regulator